MMDYMVLALALYFTVLIGVLIVIGIRILTTLDIIVRAIPLGTPRVQERRPPSPPEERGSRPVGSTSTGRH